MCAPTHRTKENCRTCYTRSALLLLITRYNETHKNKIKATPNDNLLKLWKKIYIKVKAKSRGVLGAELPQREIDWINLPFLTAEDRKYLDKFFKARTEYQGEWLSTEHIEKTLKQYEKVYKGFHLYGILPIDFVPSLEELKIQTLLKKYKIVALIFNTDPSTKAGKHWICMIIHNTKVVWFFDSTGAVPPQEVKKLLKELKQRGFIVKINKIRHQYAYTECGMYCINYVLQTLEGKTFDEISHTIYLDYPINQMRKVITVVNS